MSFWTEIHWSEGMFLRPHHLQAAQRRVETVINTGFDSLRPYAWGFVRLNIASEPLERTATPVILPRGTRITTRQYNIHLYRGRHLVECFINKIKHCRHNFSRFDEMSSRFLSLVGALIWLR